ncbi:unnamed protein product [[Candida] boidinii]|uniref:Unnamed protein product n=1 Tax=Candida boidinii TaxID=5477 RepID=A0A9W6WH20_CANBO|nr:hypothetical protein B5S30_g2410 [[Candida] boidinii]OWB85659.1 hypothetical protein B5S33_g4328 [[Candida] boidinii]GME71448.1 unnamed protein product [[Candida] boidinii]GMF50980.1 unnamed protein product [[Candida] boidinii]GMG20636.1 unnamed protein product [[Candida] boidinii]
MQGSYGKKGLPLPYNLRPKHRKSKLDKEPINFFISKRRKVLGYLLLLSCIGFLIFSNIPEKERDIDWKIDVPSDSILADKLANDDRVSANEESVSKSPIDGVESEIDEDTLKEESITEKLNSKKNVVKIDHLIEDELEKLEENDENEIKSSPKITNKDHEVEGKKFAAGSTAKSKVDKDFHYDQNEDAEDVDTKNSIEHHEDEGISLGAASVLKSSDNRNSLKDEIDRLKKADKNNN